MADCVDVGSGFVDGRVDEEASCVGGTTAIATNDLAVKVDEYHVADFQKAKVSSEGVRPESIWVFWVAHRDVAAHALDVALAVPVAKGSSHMFELPLALRGKVWMLWDACEDDFAVGHCLEGCFVFEFMAVGCVGFFGVDADGAACSGLDGGGRHVGLGNKVILIKSTGQRIDFWRDTNVCYSFQIHHLSLEVRPLNTV